VRVPSIGGRFRRPLRTRRELLVALAAAGLAELVSALAAAQEQKLLEHEEKASLILRIAQFTDWPANLSEPANPFVIGVVGADPFGPALDRTVEGQKISGRDVIVSRFATLAELRRADLLFVCASHRQSFERILSMIRGVPTLTVADYEGFAGEGGAIELFIVDGRVRFRVNRGAAEAAGLNLRSQLLRSAAFVE
jgi:YfiR/HmsC-like